MRKGRISVSPHYSDGFHIIPVSHPCWKIKCCIIRLGFTDHLHSSACWWKNWTTKYWWKTPTFLSNHNMPSKHVTYGFEKVHRDDGMKRHIFIGEMIVFVSNNNTGWSWIFLAMLAPKIAMSICLLVGPSLWSRLRCLSMSTITSS